jgi:hypothetical protein
MIGHQILKMLAFSIPAAWQQRDEKKVVKPHDILVILS